jgi:hypothetical protein
MRTIRRLTTALALMVLPQVAGAQEGRLFKDSWFWGAKVGTMKYETLVTKGYAPLIGAEWLITRTRGALYLAIDEAFFGLDGKSSVDDPYAFSGRKEVHLFDLRRATVAGIVFPTQKRGYLRPYAGAGFVLLDFHAASPVSGSSSSAENQYVAEALQDAKSGASVIGIVGLQAQFKRLSAFGQGSLMPAQGSTFLLNGNYTLIVEAGLRYNIGTSIDRPF